MIPLERLRTSLAGVLAPRLLFVVALVVFAWLAAERPSFRETRGDESTFVAMTRSLVRDLDLRFDERDLARINAGGAPPALILQRAGDSISYSKPVVYPLWCAPFVALAGPWGMLAANLVALLAALALARAALAARFGAVDGEWLLWTFAGAGALPAFAGWRMTEALQLALALAAVALALLPPGRDGERGIAFAGAPIGAGVLLGLLVSLREPNALVAAAVVVAVGLARGRRAAGRAAAGAVAGYLLALALTWGLTGAVNPYKAPRSSFDASTGYPVGEGAVAALARFGDDGALATSSLGALPQDFDARRSGYAALYFLVGRHSGLLVYFPGVALLLLVALGRPRAVGLAAAGGVGALALFYLIWLPSNYFGGETFLANRYVLAALPLALAAVARPPRRSTLALAWLVAAVAGGSALLSVARVSAFDSTIHSHVHAGLFRALPYESTASHLEGRRDRYWSGDFLRFVDPFARADAWSFTLVSPLPAAEVEIATHWPGDRLRLVAVTSGPAATLVVSDWRTRRRYPIGAGGGVIEVEPGPAWRFHPFWWAPERLYRARLLRLDLEAAQGVPVEARLRYLGRYPLPEGLGREVEGIALPSKATAGGSTLVPLRLANSGSFAWSSESVLPVQLGWRIEPVDGLGISLEGRLPLAREIPPGGVLATALRVDWPPLPARYRLTVDLVIEDLAWFADRLGAPIGSAEVVVTAPEN